MRREVEPYRPHEFESRWQESWQREGLDRTPEPPRDKRYVLEMLPYPSGDIHIGHFRNYTIGDVVARFERMRGHDVLHPFGWDAFGLPAENAAITRGIHPGEWTTKNIETSRNTLRQMGLSYDWEREVVTCRADYYKFTQWMFLLLHKRGLAYRARAAVNWCPVDQTVLANEHVVDGCCWRHPGVPVEKRELEQWFFRITEYAQRLLDDLDKLPDWPESTVKMQRSWIGRSEGAEVTFYVPGWATASGHGEGITVFTTRPDTLWGATFLTLAPEHPMVARVVTPDQRAEVDAYVTAARRKTDIERSDLTREKDGVFTGAYAINPVTHDPIPIWVADYVLGGYGTGAIMGVPAHDERDFAFASTYGLPLKVVVQPLDPAAPRLDAEAMTEAWSGEGTMVDSPPFDGTPAPEGIPQVIAWLAERGIGRAKVQFRLRDWLISRQRYWGCPIPMIHCAQCGIVPVPEEQLPIELPPNVQSFIPTGRSPLEDVPEFINTTCPQCGGPAKRDPDTMDTFVDSSWYMLRYVDANNDREPFSRERAKEWLPIDLYIGGDEHATGHLLYFRFFTKVLFDAGWVPVEEPARRLVHQGMVADAQGETMSKSKGNVVSPGALFARDGVDVPRLAMLFFAPSDAEILWSEAGIEGTRRFVHRLWETMVTTIADARFAGVATAGSGIDPNGLSSGAREAWRLVHRALERTTQACERDLAFNTAVALYMEWINAVRRVGEPTEWSDADFASLAAAVRIVAQAIAPLAPHLGEELWQRVGGEGSVFRAGWPQFDPAALRRETVEVPVQVNGKLRSRIYMAPDASKEEMEQAALGDDKVRELLAGKPPRRVIVVPGRLVNVVV
ncbi:MAG TPA: leucine--tRNA ligase [Thermoanaerobaculia bacterium]|nr:leucine--tRNA ligase [Thermoanaerobaculia bacterium]